MAVFVTFTHPARVVAVFSGHRGQQPQWLGGVQFARMRRQRLERGQHILAQRAMRLHHRIDEIPLQAEARSLETVVGIHVVIVFARTHRPLHEEVATKHLRIDCQRSGALDGQRRIADADLDRAEFGLGPDVPVEVLHAGDDAGAAHAFEVIREFGPFQHAGRGAAQRKRGNRVQSRRIEGGIHALVKRRGCRQRNEMRHVARHSMQQEHGIVAMRAADVDVLAEHGELLGEVAVQIGQVLEARPVVDLALAPVLEGMGTAAGDQDVEPLCGAAQHTADLQQFGQQ